MKKSILFIAAAASLLISCQKEVKEGNLHITGDVNGLKKGKLYVGAIQDSSLVWMDSIQVDGNSKFETHLQIDEPQMLYLFLDRGTTSSIDNSLAFFAEPGNMTIDTDLETFYAKAKVSGSKNHKLYEDFKNIRQRFTTQELDFTQKRLEAFKNKTELSAEDIAKEEGVIRRRYLATINFAMQNKDHAIAPYVLLSEVADANVKYLDTVSAALPKEIADSKYGKLLKEYIVSRKAEEAQPKQ